jgi:hypothetical protein
MLAVASLPAAFVGSPGVIVTAVQVILPDGSSTKGTVAGSDSTTNLAAVRIDSSSSLTILPFAPVAKVGEQVLAVARSRRGEGGYFCEVIRCAWSHRVEIRPFHIPHQYIPNFRHTPPVPIRDLLPYRLARGIEPLSVILVVPKHSNRLRNQKVNFDILLAESVVIWPETGSARSPAARAQSHRSPGPGYKSDKSDAWATNTTARL